jgi:hypothetical protein
MDTVNSQSQARQLAIYFRLIVIQESMNDRPIAKARRMDTSITWGKDPACGHHTEKEDAGKKKKKRERKKVRKKSD